MTSSSGSVIVGVADTRPFLIFINEESGKGGRAIVPEGTLGVALGQKFEALLIRSEKGL